MLNGADLATGDGALISKYLLFTPFISCKGIEYCYANFATPQCTGNNVIYDANKKTCLVNALACSGVTTATGHGKYEDQVCVDTCPAKVFAEENTCVAACGEPTATQNNGPYTYEKLNSCYKVCPDGTYGDPTTKKCLGCFTGCKSCDGPLRTNCKTCNAGKKLHSTLKSTFCGADLCDEGYSDGGNGQCYPCVTNCTSCAVNDDHEWYHLPSNKKCYKDSCPTGTIKTVTQLNRKEC